VTTATTMAATGGSGPLAPHMRPCAPHQCFKWMGNNPPSLQMYFGEGWRVCMALKALLCSSDDASPQQSQHWSVLRAIHILNSPKNYNCLLGGLSTIHLMLWCGMQGLMWRTRGPFLPAVAMVCYGCVGQCWPLEADVRLTYSRYSKNCLQKDFFYSYGNPIHL
jgi:hypothetical protein